jgi:hypothetical protein
LMIFPNMVCYHFQKISLKLDKSPATFGRLATITPLGLDSMGKGCDPFGLAGAYVAHKRAPPVDLVTGRRRRIYFKYDRLPDFCLPNQGRSDEAQKMGYSKMYRRGLMGTPFR